jgi:hypothetical protein
MRSGLDVGTVETNLTRPITHLPTPLAFTTGGADAGDHYIVESGEADHACRITRMPKVLFA